MKFRDILPVGVFLMFFIPIMAFAQAQPIAKIKKIAVNEGPKPILIKKSTSRVLYKGSSNKWKNAKPKIKLYHGDLVLIKKSHTYTELEMNAPNGKGRFTYWLDTLSTNKWPAAYEIRKNPKKLGFFDFVINYGSLVADKIHGRLSTKSPAIEVIATGTRYLMKVDALTGETTVFLEKGSVLAVAAGDTVLLSPLDVAKALPGQALIRLNLPPQNVSQLQRYVRVNHSEFWSQFRPWWQQWYVLAPASAAVGTGTYLFIKKDEENTISGNVFISLP